MNEYIQTNKRSLVLLTILFFVLAIVLYFMLVRPLANDLAKQENNIIEAENNLSDLEKTLNALDLAPDDEQFENLLLEKVIPKERELDEYILSLQQLELTTNSKIEDINFVYDSQIADHEQTESDPENQDESTEAATETEEQANENNDAADDEENTESEEQDNEQTLEPTFIFEKPENLHAISVRVHAMSPSLDEFIKLLKTIEQSERLSIVSQLRFEHPTEIDESGLVDDSLEDIIFQIELMTFYYDDASL